MKKFIKSRKFQAGALIAFSIILELLYSFIYRYLINTSSSFTEILYYITQIISSIFVISGVVIAVWQYYLSCQNSKTELAVVQVQKAIDLSAYYKDNIIKLSQPISYVYKNSGILKIMEDIDKNKIGDFDVHEMEILLTQKQIDSFRNIATTDDFMKAVVEANFAYSLNLPLGNAIVKKTETEIAFNKEKIYEAFMSRIVLELLNNMEYFAMHFTHNTADESVVFPSLHQTYISICQELYYNISKVNEIGQAKYYTNLIGLYKQWKLEADNTNSKVVDATRNAVNPGTIIK